MSIGTASILWIRVCLAGVRLRLRADGYTRILLCLHWSTLHHGRPLLRIPAHPLEADVPADLVERLGHLHGVPLVPLTHHILLGCQPPLPRHVRVAEEPFLWIWLLMRRHAALGVQNPWWVCFRVVDFTNRHRHGGEGHKQNCPANF